MDVGLGKTAVTLTAIKRLIDNFAIRSALVMAPLKVATIAWPDEIQKWDHARGLRVSLVRGTPAERHKALLRPADIYIINYEMTTWLVEWLYKHWTPEFFDMIVLDESSRMKAHNSGRFKMFKAISKSPMFPRIVELTGTPMPERYQDLWSQYHILDGGERLEKYWTHYLKKYFETNPYNRFETTLRDGADVAIQGKIRDITISLEAKDYLSVPPMTEIDDLVTLPPAARTMYDELAEEAAAELEDGATINAFGTGSKTEKCRQVCSGAVYDEEKKSHPVHSEKMDRLEEILEDASENMLVAYWYKHEMEEIRKRWPSAPILGPGMSDKAATEVVADWNAGKIPVLFMHPASVGHGINLQHGGSCLVIVTMPWSNELYRQMVGRLHRQGQTKPVRVIRILTKKTVDAKVAAAITKKELAQLDLRKALKG